MAVTVSVSFETLSESIYGLAKAKMFFLMTMM
jgi:hypothetical protein